MATISENRRVWNDDYPWPEGGAEWSSAWGGTEPQWYGAILPRIRRFLPAATILEIGPGYGRWSGFLKNQCSHLILVDLSEKCIEACRRRYGDEADIEYHVNDGRSLEMIHDGSVDFVFSFDSLVHAERDVVRVYLEQLSRKLAPAGAGFLHHSNLGEFAMYFGLLNLLPRGRGLLSHIGLVEPNPHWRAASMTAAAFAADAEQAGLQCIGQEKVPWVGMKRPIDCFSTVTRKGSALSGPNPVTVNASFMAEAEQIRQRWIGESQSPA